MRCNSCNVDLGETYDVCPLCGAKAEDTPPVLPDLPQADYPETTEPYRPKRQKGTVTFVPLAVATGLSVLFCVLAFGKTMLLWGLVTPPMLLGVMLYYFITGLKEKGALLPSALGLLGQIAAQVMAVLLALILHRAESVVLFLTIVAAALEIVLYTLRTERFTAQMKAFFHM